MLKHLSISNYALIDKLDVDFSESLTILTGETGAGKSIVVDALSMVLGQRADASVLQDKTKKSIVEAVFDVSPYKLENFFSNNELDYEKQTTIRREINPEGKSRAFVNDTPVILNLLRELTSRLIDIHSQHETLIMKEHSFRVDLLDAMAGNEKLISDYREELNRFRALKKEYEELLQKQEQAKREEDYFAFQFNELEEANLKAGEEESVENELSVLTHAEEIKQSLSAAVNALSTGDETILSSLEQVRNLVAQSAKYNASLSSLTERIKSVLIELKDIAAELETAEADTVFSPEKMEELSNRINVINHLLSKHRLTTAEELLSLKSELEAKLKDISSYDDKIAELKKEWERSQKKVNDFAASLSEKRKKIAPQLEKKTCELLAKLGIPNARLEIKISAKPEPDDYGKDNVLFDFSANKGESLKELDKVASGGELSRLMLAFKSILAEHKNLPAIVFDEIDTGVSGEIAGKMGTIMKAMSVNMQVLVITHLPQIAGKGEFHLQIYKEEKAGKTFTRLKKLGKEERILEIAKMLSTGTPTEAAIKNAKELLVKN
ncbi:MAG: DNA repair protein RecN [Bacteroidia bacterium]|nr:DNA repair protein RecN [Bacteroidia bacterium]